MSNEKQNVLVAGANGTTGKIIINLLNESENYKPIAMVRKQVQKDRFEKENISAIVADLEHDIDHALINADKVIFAAGSKGTNVIGVDQKGAMRLIDAAKNAGIRKFVMLSTMGADDPSVNEKLKDYLKAKQKADEYLKVSGLNYSIVRPGSLTDNEGNGNIQLKEKLENHGSISRADVAKTLVQVLENDVKHNQVFEILAGETTIENAITHN